MLDVAAGREQRELSVRLVRRDVVGDVVPPAGEDELVGVLAAAREAAQRVFILGGGSNLLVGDRGILLG